MISEISITLFISGIAVFFVSFVPTFRENLVYMILFRVSAALLAFGAYSLLFLSQVVTTVSNTITVTTTYIYPTALTTVFSGVTLVFIILAIISIVIDFVYGLKSNAKK